MNDSRHSPRYPVSQVYPELLKGLCALLGWSLADKFPSQGWYGTFYTWFEKDLALWRKEKRADHHLLAFGGMGSFNDLVDPGPDFPGGKNGFGRFYGVYLLFKELSYWSAALWERFRADYRGRIDEELLFIPTGIPVTICTCSSGHRWMQGTIEGLTFHANQIAAGRQCLSLILEKGGEQTMAWLLDNNIVPDPGPVLVGMRAALQRAGVEAVPGVCQACQEGKVATETHYLFGSPLELSKEFFRIEKCMTSHLGPSWD